MTRECLPVEDLGEIRSWDDDDPRREHIAGCPRCRSLLDSYSLFLRGSELPLDAAAEAMDRRLEAALEREVFPERRPVPERESRSARTMSGWERFIDLLTGRRLRWAWGGAAAALAIALVLIGTSTLHRAGGPAGDRVVLRQGTTDQETSFRATVEAAGPGQWVFSWSRVAAADGYALVLLGTDLAERRRFEVPASETRLPLAERDLDPPGMVPGSPVFWQVLALRGGDEIAHSRPRPLAGER